MQHKLNTTLSFFAALSLSAIPACRTCTPRASLGVGESPLLVNTDRHGVALDGHDPVAFFTAGAPVMGRKELAVRHEGATYRFADEGSRRLFEADPQRYVPAFGGYCGYAASIRRISPIDVRFFQVLDGRLVLQHNQRAWDLWNADLEGNMVKADANWPELVRRHGRGEKQLINVDGEGLALEGHDAVAYFTEHRPVLGRPEIEANYNGAIWRFASKEHRETFEDDPARYAPAFGGFCGYAASINKVSPVNIHIWQIQDGRLVLQHTPKAYRLFNDDLAESVRRADENWPGLVACKGK